VRIAAALTTVLLVSSLHPAAAAAAATAPPASSTPASADDAALELAQRYAPVVRMVAQATPCERGDAFDPADVDAVLGRPEVALRGPWESADLVTIGPTADDLAGSGFDYHLDFPGDALDPGCAYEQWFDTVRPESAPTTYARVVGDPAHPGALALQYWFFYVFNDFNNTHEGDWEMVQLLFDAADATDALRRAPTVVGYSQHEGAERADWGTEKLELVGGTHPVVYPAAGSHANYFDAALHLGRSGAQGVGCDDTVGPHRELRPRVRLVPADEKAARQAYPWLAYPGRWGEAQDAFYNGPTGPPSKEQWRSPVEWAGAEWREASAVVPLADTVGPNAASFFCGAVGAGSTLLTRVTAEPAVGLALLALAVVALVMAARRTRWSPAVPFPLRAPRATGQVLASAARLYRRHPRLMLGIGLAYLPIMALASLLTAVLLGLAGVDRLAGGPTPSAFAVLLAVVPAAGLGLLAYVSVLAAVAAALPRLDRGEPATVLGAYGDVRRRLGALTGVVVRFVAVVTVLTLPVVTLPLALLYAVRRSFAVPVLARSPLDARSALRRSAQLTRGAWWPTARVLALVVGVGALTGPLVGVALLFLTGMSITWVNAVSSLVYVVTIPFVAAALVYVFEDLLAREDAAAATTITLDVPAGVPVGPRG
jgi:hypothetical protein